MEKDLFSSPHLVNLIFLAGAPTVTLILPSSHSLKFSTSFFFQGEYNRVLILCVFALTERKTEILYRREKVRENFEIAYQTAMCYFKKASINSFMFCYPSTPLIGCFFHFR
ncbi:LOW QUALITY PROTEIN: hypothetical protein HZS_1936 [Henneguya salminicola]|nr:LOW QUALITY PROTEIN: hypothetical protein HZS_1936 [Henneguya salminicola]